MGTAHERLTRAPGRPPGWLPSRGMRRTALTLVTSLVLLLSVLPAAAAADPGRLPVYEGMPAGYAAFGGQNGPLIFSASSGDIGILTPQGPAAFARVLQNLPQSTPETSPDGSLVVFQVNGQFNTLIGIANTQTGQGGLLTTDQMPISFAMSPSFTPDGQRVVFTAVDPRTQIAGFYTVPVAGGQPELLTDQVIGSEPRISPAGDQLMYWREDTDEIHYLDLRTGVDRTVYRSDPGPGEGIFFGQHRLQTNSQGQPFINILDFDWRPDARAFLVNCGDGAVCEMAADGSGVLNILTNPALVAQRPVSGATYSPDATQVLYSGPTRANDLSAFQIFVIPATGAGANFEAEQQVTFSDGQSNSFTQPVVAVAPGTGTQRPAATPCPGGAGAAFAGTGGCPTTGGPGPDPGPGPGPDPGPGPGPTPPGGGNDGSTPGGSGAGAGVFSGDPAAPTEIAAGDPSTLALALSSRRFPAGVTARWAVLSRDDTFPDSLAGTALTGEGPMLFTPSGSLVPGVATELQRVLAPGSTVYLLGGEVALAPAVEQAVRDLGLTPVRLAGASRIQTALAVADEVRRVFPNAPAQVLLARAGGPAGNPTAGWADSVSAGAGAAYFHAPILLTDSASLDPGVAAWLQADGSEATVLIGGTAALAPEIEQQVPNGFRIAGADRTETAQNLAAGLFGDTFEGERRYLLVNGRADDGWAYGLAAAGLGADARAPIVLVDPPNVSPANNAMVRECGAKAVDTVAIGDTSVVPQSIRDQVEALDGLPC